MGCPQQRHTSTRTNIGLSDVTTVLQRLVARYRRDVAGKKGCEGCTMLQLLSNHPTPWATLRHMPGSGKRYVHECSPVEQKGERMHGVDARFLYTLAQASTKAKPAPEAVHLKQAAGTINGEKLLLILGGSQNGRLPY